jgi:stage II sporulation protein AB (anti-sigma F factor)
VTDTEPVPSELGSRIYTGPPYVAGSLPAAEPGSVSMARRTILGFAREHGVRRADLDRIALAVSEAAANVVLHAYASHERGALHYTADLGDEDLQVIIADDGHGIRPGHDVGGLGVGLRLIAETTSDFAITARDPRGLEVWMRFVLE